MLFDRISVLSCPVTAKSCNRSNSSSYTYYTYTDTVCVRLFCSYILLSHLLNTYCCLSKFICLCHISSLMFLSIPSLMFSFSPPILPLISPYISPPLIFSPVSPLTCIFLFFAHFSSFYSTYFSSYFSLYFSSYFSSYFFLLTLLVLFICEPVFKGSVSRDFRPPVFS